MNICLVSSKEGAAGKMAKQWGAELNFTLFSHHIEDFSAFEAVLIVEPYECRDEKTPDKGGLYTSIFEVWRRYLAREAPQVKLLVAGYWDSGHPNFIPLLSLSTDFDWQAKMAGANPTDKEWPKPLHSFGEPLLNKLQRFFKGHSSEGIIDTLAKVRQSLSNAYYQMEEQEEDFKEIWRDTLRPRREACRKMLHRWNDYRPFFFLS